MKKIKKEIAKLEQKLAVNYDKYKKQHPKTKKKPNDPMFDTAFRHIHRTHEDSDSDHESQDQTSDLYRTYDDAEVRDDD